MAPQKSAKFLLKFSTNPRRKSRVMIDTIETKPLESIYSIALATAILAL